MLLDAFVARTKYLAFRLFNSSDNLFDSKENTHDNKSRVIRGQIPRRPLLRS